MIGLLTFITTQQLLYTTTVKCYAIRLKQKHASCTIIWNQKRAVSHFTRKSIYRQITRNNHQQETSVLALKQLGHSIPLNCVVGFPLKYPCIMSFTAAIQPCETDRRMDGQADSRPRLCFVLLTWSVRQPHARRLMKDALPLLDLQQLFRVSQVTQQVDYKPVRECLRSPQHHTQRQTDNPKT